jgi:hypothetical protein
MPIPLTNPGEEVGSHWIEWLNRKTGLSAASSCSSVEAPMTLQPGTFWFDSCRLKTPFCDPFGSIRVVWRRLFAILLVQFVSSEDAFLPPPAFEDP